MRTLTSGATVYELTDEERATMKRLIDARLVIGIGKHAKLKALIADLVTALESAEVYLLQYAEPSPAPLRALIRETLAAAKDTP